MPRKPRVEQPVEDQSEGLKSRLAETEETLRAIQEYMVDAFVVNRENGIQVVTLNESEIPYRMMVESMNEGAVTLIPDGTIFYCYGRFGEMIQGDCEKVGNRVKDNNLRFVFTNQVVHRYQVHFKPVESGAGNMKL